MQQSLQVTRIVALVGCLLFSGIVASALHGDQSRPNVLVIMLDDLNDYTGFMGGHPQVMTPHMDALAKEGVVFRNAHSNAPICAPSRSSMLTGIYPHVSGNYWFKKWHENDILINCKPLALFLKDNGYLSYGTGKLMHDRRKSDWTEYGIENSFGPYPYNGKRLCGHPSVPEPFRKLGKNDGLYGPLSDVPQVKPTKDTPGYTGWHSGNPWRPFRYVDEDDRDLMIDEQQAQWAVNKLQELDAANETTPFLLAVGFVRPHTPLVAPKKYFDLYPKESLVLPVILPGDKDDTHLAPLLKGQPWAQHYFELIKSFEGSDDALRTYLQAYLACITFADDQVGKVLDALRASQFNENTVVILTSDHGYHHGQKDFLFKSTLWEKSTQVPMIIRMPDAGANAGKSVHHPVSLIDIYPTIADLAQLESVDNRLNENGAHLNGHSLLPFVHNLDAGRWDGPPVALSVVKSPGPDALNRMHNFSVRSKDYRYIRYSNGKEELYHNAVDPHEWTNLASNPEYAQTKADLKTQMDTLIGDPR